MNTKEEEKKEKKKKGRKIRLNPFLFILFLLFSHE
jgi:hypothetical protein